MGGGAQLLVITRSRAGYALCGGEEVERGGHGRETRKREGSSGWMWKSPNILKGSASGSDREPELFPEP